MSGPWPERAACRLDALADPGVLEFFVGEGDWPFRGLVVCNGGAIRAYANWCPHKGHPLNLAAEQLLGTLPGRGTLLHCASHGALFMPENGLCVEGPCAGRSLKPLECRVADGTVWVRAPEKIADLFPPGYVA